MGKINVRIRYSGHKKYIGGDCHDSSFFVFELINAINLFFIWVYAFTYLPLALTWIGYNSGSTRLETRRNLKAILGLCQYVDRHVSYCKIGRSKSFFFYFLGRAFFLDE